MGRSQKITLAVFLTLCLSAIAHAFVPSLYIKTAFSPSFTTSVTLFIQEKNDTSRIYIHLNLRDTIVKDSAGLTAIELQQFLIAADTNNLFHLAETRKRNQLGFDGITITGDIYINKEENHYSIWTPTRLSNPGFYRFLDPLFALAYSKLPIYEDYLENVQDYFEYGLPVKIKSTSPFIVKIYGSLSIDDQPALRAFFDSIPTDSIVILDMSNFGGMGTLLYPDFQKFDDTHKYAIWITPGNYRQYFAKVGIRRRKMVKDIDEARKGADKVKKK